MGAPYSQDLRERVISVVDGGMGAYEAAPCCVSAFPISTRRWGVGGRPVRRRPVHRDAGHLRSWLLTMMRCASGSRRNRTPRSRRYGRGCWPRTA
jgi:hypothetical protein